MKKAIGLGLLFAAAAGAGTAGLGVHAVPSLIVAFNVGFVAFGTAITASKVNKSQACADANLRV